MSRERNIWMVLRGTLLVLAGSMIMACATPTGPVALQQTQEIDDQAVLQTCQVVQDQELAEMRGCYDTYSFGLSITGNLDMATKNFTLQTNYSQAIDTATKMGGQLTISSTGSQVQFNNGNVSFTAGIGQNALGSGIMQVVQVAGSNIMVVANMDVTLNINNAVSLKPTAGIAFTTPGTLAGIR